MIILFILGLFLGAFAVVFALQNVEVITVTFFSWELTSSLSVIIFVALLSGVLIALLLFLPESLKNYFRYRKLKRENARLEEELRKQKEKTLFAKEVPPKPEDIERIEKGAIDGEIM